MDLTAPQTHSATISKASGHNPRKRGRTACSRCKARKQKCDANFPSCSNCKKAGAECDVSSIRQENAHKNAYTRALEERITQLEEKLAQSGTAAVASTSGYTDGIPAYSTAPLMAGQCKETPLAEVPTGFDNNAVGELVGFLALSSSEAPAYVGSSSGLSLAVNLGEMVQATVWNQVLSPRQNQPVPHLPNDNPVPNVSYGARGIPPQPPNASKRFCDQPFKKENLLPASTEPPNDEAGARILDAYLTRLHVRYPFLDRVELWRLHGERRRLAMMKREELSKSERFGIFKLYLVYAIGATQIQLSENITLASPQRFYLTALQQVPGMCETRSVENIEAMILLVIYHLRTASSHGIWYMIGLAMRTAVDMGLHRKANEINLDPVMAQMYRRLFWTVYYLERVVSMSLGRPFSLSDRHIDVELPLDVNDDVRDPALLSVSQSPGRLTTMTFSIYLIRLRRIESKVQHKIYRADRSLQSLRSKMDRLYLELEEWKISATSRFSGSDLDYPILHYNKAVRLLIQPFLPLLSITDPYYHICLRAAGDICQTHKRLHQALEYGHSFLAVQSVFLAGITLLYALWTHTDQLWSVQMSNDIRACSTVLFVMGERAAWVKKYRDAYELLVNAAMEKLEGNGTAKTVGMAELMTAQHGSGCFGAPGAVPVAMNPDDVPRADEPIVSSVTDPDVQPQPESHEHGVRMALQLAPWIDQGDKSPLWMPDFQALESSAGSLWNGGDPTPFDFL